MSNQTFEPAFPTTPENYEQSYSEPGMSIKDYFAAKAMQAFITGAMSDGSRFSASSGDHDTVAKVAYLIAEAMLRAREAS